MQHAHEPQALLPEVHANVPHDLDVGDPEILRVRHAQLPIICLGYPPVLTHAHLIADSTWKPRLKWTDFQEWMQICIVWFSFHPVTKPTPNHSGSSPGPTLLDLWTLSTRKVAGCPRELQWPHPMVGLALKMKCPALGGDVHFYFFCDTLFCSALSKICTIPAQVCFSFFVADINR